MKKVAFTLLLYLFFVPGYSQDDDFKTLFDYEDVRISGFGGPMMNFSMINNEFAYLMGGGGGVLLGDFYFGGYGLGLTNTIYADDYNNAQFEFGHGGFWTGYSFFASKAIHPAFFTTVGWGEIVLYEPQPAPFDRDLIDQEGIFVVTPAIEVEANFARFFRMCLAVNYRFVMGIDNFADRNNEEYTWQDFSSPGVFLTFKFGWF